MSAPPFVEGIFYDMPASTYHAIEAMSNGGAEKILRSPAHYRLTRATQNAPTEAMEFGTAVHTGVLEPDKFQQRVVMLPEVNKRTNAGKALYAEFLLQNPGCIVLSADDFDRCRRTIDAVRAHPGAKTLLDGARTEVSLFWKDARYGVPCKCRWDASNHDGVIDLKTTQDASPEAFARSIANFGYHRQSAHYMSGGEHVLNATPRFFAIIAAESAEPHGVACYVLPGNAVLAGQHLMNKALVRYRDALAAGAWPGYPDTIEQITLPKWATMFND